MGDSKIEQNLSRSWADKKPTLIQLQEIINDHQTWLAEGAKGAPPHSLAYSDLKGVDLKAIDLSGMQLQRSNLAGADLKGSKLRGADFTGAILRSATLDNCDLVGSILISTDLNSASLRMADLHYADLSFSNLRQADISRADIRWAVLKGADLSNANFNDTKIRDANLEGARLLGVDLSLADSQAKTYVVKASGGAVSGGSAKVRFSRAPGAPGLEGEDTGQDDTSETSIDIEQNLASKFIRAQEKVDKESRALIVMDKGATLARKLFTPMLITCSYIALSISLDDGGRIVLPIIQVKVPPRVFLVATPILLLGIYLYFHIYLQRLFQQATLIPMVSQSGINRFDRVDPWLLIGIMRRYERSKEREIAILDRVQAWLAIFLSWYIPPITLAYIWWAGLDKAGLIVSWVQSGCVGVAACLGMLFWGQTLIIFAHWEQKTCQKWSRVAMLLGLLLSLALAYASWALTLDVPICSLPLWLG